MVNLWDAHANISQVKYSVGPVADPVRHRKSKQVLNNCMSELNQKETERKGRGGVRPGAGRPKGAKDRVTVSGILDALEQRTNGRTYEDILIEDFVNARMSGDMVMTHKYHTLLSNKFIANLNEITVENLNEAVNDKESQFLEAVKALNNINKSKDKDNASD